MFTAVTTFPWGLPDPTLSHQWQWEFGDGSQSPESDRQTVSHAYGAPGTYDVAVIVTDSTGISTFGSAEIAISAP